MTACAGIKGKLIIVGQCKLYYQGLRKEKGKVGVEFIFFSAHKKRRFRGYLLPIEGVKKGYEPA